MGNFRTVPVAAGTNLRWGGSTEGDVDAPNVIGTLRAGDYTALVQCAGQDVTEGADSNYWWVLLDTYLGRGWVSAVRILEGGNDEPIKNVTTAVTVYDFPGSDQATTVHVVSGGAQMYRGGSTRSEPYEPPVQVPAGPYPAQAQCGGEDVTIGTQHNFRWVLVNTPQGSGWISAVQVREGDNGAPVPGVPAFPTVFSLPPDLLP